MSLDQASFRITHAPSPGDRLRGDFRRDGLCLNVTAKGAEKVTRLAAIERNAKKPLRQSVSLPVDCGACLARKSGLCFGASPETLRLIERYKWGDRKIRSGQDLFSAGDPCDSVYNLVEGWMFLYSLLEDGRRQILHFALPGAVLGFHAWRMATHSAQALTDAVVCVIPRKALEPLSKERPEIAMRLASLMSRDRSLGFDHLTSIGRQSARERVAHLLLELFVRYRGQWLDGRIEEMQLPLTQEHIGDATGLTFVHVNRVLRNLREEGVVEFHYRRLRILDPDKLIDVAGIDPHLAMSWMRQGAFE